MRIDGITPAWRLRRTRQISFMPSGWIKAVELGPEAGGTACLTIGCPGDFHAVRLGFANVTKSNWTLTKVIGRASATYNDYVSPTGAGGWTSFTFAACGQPDARIVTDPDAPTQIDVKPSEQDTTTGLTGEPHWTWTDWAPLSSAGADPGSGMRVLMLRALVPSSQTVCFANGLLRKLTGNVALNQGFDCFIGGIKRNYDRVTDPSPSPKETTETWASNTVVSGSLIPIVQFLTRQAGVVGMVCGDSHQQGTTTTEQFTGFGYRAMAGVRTSAGGDPVGVVNCAAGGLTSPQFFGRLRGLLPIVQPAYVVLPGWTYNDRNGPLHADRASMEIFFARLLESIEACQRTGSLPIILTPFPRDRASMTSVQLEPWRRLRQEILSLADTNLAVLDATSVLGAQANGLFDGTYLPGLSDDEKHPNDFAHSALARLLVKAVSSAQKVAA